MLENAEQAGKRLAETETRRERLRAASEILRQVLIQDVEPDPDEPNGRGKKLRQGTSAERVCSVHDPEIRHGRKNSSTRFDGHKAQVVVDADSGLVAAASVMAGSAKDEEGSLEVVQEAGVETGLEVEVALADCAYGSGQNRARFEQAGIELLAKVSRPVQSKYFTKQEFTIDLDAVSCRCPAGQVTSRLRRQGQSYAFSFPSQVFARCPLRAGCYSEKEKSHGRQVAVHPQEALLQKARAWQHSLGIDEFRKLRQVVEHRIARLLQLGIRQARYVGRHKTEFQVLLAAAVANLTLMAGKIGQTASPKARRALQAVLLALQELFSRCLCSDRATIGASPDRRLSSSCSPTSAWSGLETAHSRPRS